MRLHFMLHRQMGVWLMAAALSSAMWLAAAQVAQGEDAPGTPAPAAPVYPGIPAAPATQPSDAPAGYSVAVETDSGKAWVTKKPGITTVTAALEATIGDLTTFFGSKPAIKGAFEDTKDHQSGAASFAASVAGKNVIGLATCKLGDHEARISVTYCLATATPADWARLNSTAAAAKPAGPGINLTRLNFPDGTGSVGIADGWTLKCGSVLDPLYITGPADQSLGGPGLFFISIEVPDSPRIRQAREMQQRADANWRRMGRQPPPPLPFPYPVIGEVADPEHALPVVFPQWNAFRVAHNLESVTIDAITSAKTIAPGQPAWTTQVLEYGMTKNVNGVAKHFKVRATWSTIPPGKFLQSQWALTPANGMIAPDATFDQDVTTMQEMARSLVINWDNYFKVDDERFQARMRANQQAFDERMRAQRRQQVETMKSYAEHNRQVAIEQNRKSRNAADWIEYAGGYRTVIDTQTGQRASVDLSNVNGIVNSLNESANDPHRYVQIPLRDERNPIGGR